MSSAISPLSPHSCCWCPSAPERGGVLVGRQSGVLSTLESSATRQRPQKYPAPSCQRAPQHPEQPKPPLPGSPGPGLRATHRRSIWEGVPTSSPPSRQAPTTSEIQPCERCRASHGTPAKTAIGRHRHRSCAREHSRLLVYESALQSRIVLARVSLTKPQGVLPMLSSLSQAWALIRPSTTASRLQLLFEAVRLISIPCLITD
ncbi:hypothetical protein B0T14DRAFT_37739 [Immersiella caudata]|uniref:Uncharacterized protein n=1 Tax=Immersiella caudata TaxID=314043 RepID=A0AA39XEP7_9PEZI|nr:hypothetical protein B0T14DRAFT_37739 [Immersiella caudata]